MDAIPLTALLPEDFDPASCKVHFAVWNQVKHPIDVLATDWNEWQGWNSWRSVKDDFNRELIFSVAQDKGDATRWLFGGIWEVLERRPEQQAQSYTVALREDLMGPFIRRLFIRHARSGRNIRRTMESVLPTMTVSSILEEPFAGDPFPGHDRINHSLADLQAVVSQARADWRIALESMKGVYVIHDKRPGRGTSAPRTATLGSGTAGRPTRRLFMAATSDSSSSLRTRVRSTTGSTCGSRSWSTSRCELTTTMCSSASRTGRTCSTLGRSGTTRTDRPRPRVLRVSRGRGA